LKYELKLNNLLCWTLGGNTHLSAALCPPIHR